MASRQLTAIVSRDKPTFKVVIAFVASVAMLLFAISLLLNRAQNDQIKSEETTVEQLKAQGDSIRGQLAQTGFSLDVIHSETKIPHPILADRDARLIGQHVDISWTDDSQARFSEPIYVISVTRLRSSVAGVLDPLTSVGPKRLPGAPSTPPIGDSPGAVGSSPTHRGGRSSEQPLPGCSVDPSELTSPPSGEDDGCEELFVASDSVHRTSRVPTQLTKALRPGRYVWRVAAVSQGYQTRDNADPDIGMLSTWSNYGSFVLSKDLQDRIVNTRRVRVGVNLEQNSRFARNEAGFVVGDDVSLVKMLVEGCTSLRGTPRGVVYDKQACLKYYTSYRQCDKRVSYADPTRDHDIDECLRHERVPQLTVDFVPLSQWGSWREALRRREIDLFIGGLTAASARESGGIVFVKKGYLSYQTLLYVAASDTKYRNATLREWTSHPRRVGVIENTSNETLLDYIIGDRCPSLLRLRAKVGPDHAAISGAVEWKLNDCPITKVVYRAYPELDRAMDTGAIDGLLVDSTFVTKGEWAHLPFPSTLAPKAWLRYQAEFLGYKGLEHLSFAAAVDGSSSSGGLVKALDEAMQAAPIAHFVAATYKTRSQPR